MIDWINLGANALWILGSALALGSLSYAFWEAGVEGVPLRYRLRQDTSQIRLAASGALFCMGLAGTSDTGLELALWLLLGLAFLAQSGFLRWGKR